MNLIQIRKSPITLVSSIILFQTVYLLFVTIMTVYLDDSDTVFFGSKWRVVVLMVAAGVTFMVYLFARWYVEMYEISSDEILHRYGIVNRRKKVIKKSADFTYETNESAIGRVLKFQDITVHYGKREIHFSAISTESLKLLLNNLGPSRETLKVDDLKKYTIRELLDMGENTQLEFKSTLRWDLKNEEYNKDLEEATIKNIAAFLNTTGGVLLIGIDDERKIVGLSKDFESLKKQNEDGFENHINQLFKKYLGTESRNFINISFQTINGEKICRIDVGSAPEPVFTTFKGKEHFFIKTGNSVTSLDLREAVKYFQLNFENEGSK
jgi:membrane protein YdbS with pleckstrin-like domain